MAFWILVHGVGMGFGAAAAAPASLRGTVETRDYVTHRVEAADKVYSHPGFPPLPPIG